MNIIYLATGQLNIVYERLFDDDFLSKYFSVHKHKDLIVLSSDGVLLGYINDLIYKKNRQKTVCPIKQYKTIISQDAIDAFQVELFFRQAPNVDTLPIIDSGGKLVGAYIRDYPEELMSYDRIIRQIAINTIFAFKNEFALFINKRGYENVFILSDDNDYNILHNIFPNYKRYNYQDNNKPSKKLVIDILYSKSYRNMHYKKGDNLIFVPIESLVASLLVSIVDQYIKDNSASIIYIEAPIKEKIFFSNKKWPSLFSGQTLADTLHDDKLLDSFYHGDSNLISWAKDDRNGILAGTNVITNGIHLVMSDFDNINSINEVETKWKRSVRIYGSCLTYGACVPKHQSISALLNKIINSLSYDYDVLNYGVKNGHSVLNDLLYILNTPINSGDIIVDINLYDCFVEKELLKNHTINILSDYLNAHNSKEWEFLDSTFHANASINETIAEYILFLIKKNKHQHKPILLSTKNYYEITGKVSLFNPSWVLKKGLLHSYIEYINNNKVTDVRKKNVGSVILTANPVTKGHEYLINEAKKRCDCLYVFVVEENRFFFSTTERLNMVKRVINDPNIIVLTTGSLMTAPFTFPEYFNQEHNNTNNDSFDIPLLHFQIFGSIIAPLLNIKLRLVGEETSGTVTDLYNKKLLAILPCYGIKVEVIPRIKTIKGKIISASTVRSYVEKKDFESLEEFISPSVLEFIKYRKYGIAK